MQRLLTLFAVVLLAGCAATAGAQSQSNEPPQIAGRLSLAEGDVQIWRVEEETEGQWDLAQVNDVVTIGTGLYTGPNGRAEFRIGPNTYRLTHGSRGGFSQLDYAGAVFNLEHGTLNVRLARSDHGETTAVTVDGNMRIDLASPGRYRIDAGDGRDGQGLARISVFAGHANAQTGGAIGIASGQALVISAGLGSTNFERITSTEFDQWALSRDDRYRDVRSAQYVSPYMTGYEELDFHGEWTSDATYGNVWVPRAVPVGWAPYRHGQWRWVRPWGWTWVDHAPWGYAPFHYGRWVTINDRWCWWPGGYHRRPVWAPALVGFVGGSNVSVSVIGGPVVGWYPLAPWHRYRPHYPHNNHYTTIVNQTIVNERPRRDFTRTPPNSNPEGTTIVPGQRFRDPIMRVALPVRSDVVLPETGAPPKNIGQGRRVGDDMIMRRPNYNAQPTQTISDDRAARVPGSFQAPKIAPIAPPQANTAAPAPALAAPGPQSPPTRVMPPMQATPIPSRGVAVQPPLPGNDPTPLAQPPKFRVPSTVIQNTPPPPRAVQDFSRLPRARMPEELLPQAQQQPRNAAEPPRIPPGAPPTIRPMQEAPRGVAPASPATAPEAPRPKQPMARGFSGPSPQMVR